MSKPIVAIVGRPNVGKSTLFNALAGENISIVKDTPGVTRDRIYADVEWLNVNFTLIDTGGIEPDSSDVILAQMRDQAQIAIDTADVILFLTDCKQGLVDADAKVADMLNNKYVLISLYVDDKTPLPEQITVTDTDGTQRTLRTVGDKWSYLQRHKFGSNTQPMYILLDNEGKPLTGSRSYDEDINEYMDFLKVGLDNYNK